MFPEKLMWSDLSLSWATHYQLWTRIYCCAELSGKSIPIHCVLDGEPFSETSNTPGSTKSARDSYVVVPGNALFADLVHIVLARIGFTPVDALAAKGRSTLLKSILSLFRFSTITQPEFDLHFVEQLLLLRKNILAVHFTIKCRTMTGEKIQWKQQEHNGNTIHQPQVDLSAFGYYLLHRVSKHYYGDDKNCPV